MNTSKLTLSLMVASLWVAGVPARAADAETAPPPAGQPAARPTTLPPAATKQGVTFANDIKPLFEASCVKCHSGQRAKARLHLDTREGVLAGSEDGKVLVSGDSAKSKLVTAIARLNPKTAMPPEPRPRRAGGAPGAEAKSEPAPGTPGSPGPRNQGPPAKPLTPEEVGLVRAWIDQGAK
jgi:hypothetical protein